MRVVREADANRTSHCHRDDFFPFACSSPSSHESKKVHECVGKFRFGFCKCISIKLVAYTVDTRARAYVGRNKRKKKMWKKHWAKLYLAKEWHRIMCDMRFCFVHARRIHAVYATVTVAAAVAVAAAPVPVMVTWTLVPQWQCHLTYGCSESQAATPVSYSVFVSISIEFKLNLNQRGKPLV